MSSNKEHCTTLNECKSHDYCTDFTQAWQPIHYLFQPFCLVSRTARAKMKEKPNQINDHSSNVPTDGRLGETN